MLTTYEQGIHAQALLRLANNRIVLNDAEANDLDRIIDLNDEYQELSQLDRDWIAARVAIE